MADESQDAPMGGSNPEEKFPDAKGGEGVAAGSAVEEGKPSSENSDDASNLDMEFIMDIPLTVSVEVGRTKLLIHELLQLSQGSVIELDKQMGEPFEVLVNEKLVARGEIVVVNDRFGVRLTDIITPAERVQTLA